MDIQILDQDCLIHIFKYLPLVDIIKLEESSSIFKESTRMYYRTIKKFECNIRNIKLNDITSILTKIGPHLKVFHFSGGFIMPKDYKRTLISYISVYCRSLKKLTLNYVPLELCDLEDLTKVTVNLEELDFGNCHIADKDLQVIFLHCSKQHLKRLKLNGNSMLTGECLTEFNQIEKLDISYCYALDTQQLCIFLKQNNNLKCLDVSGSYMLDWKKIFTVLSECQTDIEELYMLNLGVDETQVPYQSFRHLRVFDIKGNRLGT